jgi:tetratricopeptide (TPR) repeat protein
MRSREHEGVALFGIAREQLAARDGSNPHPAWGWLLLPWYDLLLQSKGRPEDPSKIKVQAKTSLVMANKRDDRLGIAHANILLGHFVEPAEAIKLYEQALVLVPRLDDSFWIRIRIGFCYRIMGDYRKALEAFQKSYERGVAIDEQEKKGWSRYNMAEAEMNLGDTQNALIHMQQAYTHFCQVGTIWGCIWAKIQLSLIMFLEGNFKESRSLIEEAQQIASDTNRTPTIQKEVQVINGFLALVEGDYINAHNLFEDVLSDHPTTVESALGLVFARCGLGDFDPACQNFADVLPVSTTFRYQMVGLTSLPAAALILNYDGQPEWAVELLALAFKHPFSPKNLLREWPLIMQLQSDLEKKLTPKAFEAARGRGGGLDLNETFSNLAEHFHGDLSPRQSLDPQLPILPGAA